MERKRILITGGTGSLGTALVRHWYGQHELTVLSRDPHKQSVLRREFPQMTFILADIGDRSNSSILRRACAGQDILIHAAAIKIVSEGQYHPPEYKRTNIDGSQNIIEAWVETENEPYPKDRCRPMLPRRALAIGSDKQKSALNCYGASKKMMETFFRYYDASVLCYGNVVESRGSFFRVWQERIAKGEPIEVREPDPTRFFLTMNEAVALVEDALRVMDSRNGIFVPHSLRAFSIEDVAKAINHPYQVKPIEGYEKRDEVLVVPGEGVRPVSDLLSEIFVPYWGNEAYLYPFQSNTTRLRMSGHEVLEALGWAL